MEFDECKYPPCMKPDECNAISRIAHFATGLRRDTGLAANLLGIDTEEHTFSSQYRGSLYENAVMVEIIKRHQALGRELLLFYWRDSNKKEIDAILEQGGRPRYAVEVKSSATYNPKSFATLEDLAPMMDVPTEGRFMVYGGDEAFSIRHSHVIGLGDFGRLVA